MSSQPSTPVLILLHGATLSGAMWAPVRRHLDARWDVLAPDLPGHGTRRGEPFTLEGAVETVRQAVHAVAPRPVVLAGDSLGGYTALAAAGALPPAQLHGLVVGGCTSNIDTTLTKLHFRGKALMFKLLVSLFGESRLTRMNEPKVRQLLIEQGGVLPADAEAVIAGGLSLSVFEQCVNALWNVDFLARLQRIRQPVWLLNGDEDHVMLRQESRFLAAGPNVHGRRFDCGHGVSILRSRQFAQLLNAVAEASAVRDQGLSTATP